MASKSDFDTFLAPFWVAFGVILKASGRQFGTFWLPFFKVDFLMDFVSPGHIEPCQGVPGEGL